jgi:protein-S-isoprenylcysteine O-methyltransferase Ste14
LFVGALLIAWLLETRVYSLPITTNPAIAFRLLGAGYLIAIIGIAFASWGTLTFARAGTAIIPNKPASRLVETGPYRFTRNPMYTGLTIAYIGGILILDSIWPLLLLPFSLTLLYVFVVKREERYLLSEFGEAYEAYRKRVKRWV